MQPASPHFHLRLRHRSALLLGLVLGLCAVLGSGRAVAASAALAGPGAAGPPEAGGSRSIAALDRAVAEGSLSWSEAARQKLLFLFDRAAMDPRFDLDAGRPARCATPILADLARQQDRLDAAGRQLWARYVDPGPAAGGGAPGTQATLSYQTTNFYLEYNTTGPNVVPLTDVAPANGVPDYVEQAGAAMEYVRSVEVGTLAYLAPPGSSASQYNGKYLIQFQAQNSYGYTSALVGTRTKIVLHNNYLGFPPNQDPDGPVLGAMRVTAAHEFKHAIQRVYSSWSEGGWVELDATWMEDQVYDQINDYYNYLTSAGSPFTEPQTPLDSDGTNTTGSYEDCVWQHYQTEKLGVPHMRNFWVRRQAFPAEPVLTTYAQNLLASGLSFEDAWGEYVAWNFATGTNGATNGNTYGYGEEAEYPGTPATSTTDALPVATTAGTVAHLAANAHVIRNADLLLSGQPEFTFTGDPAVAWRVSIVARTRAGAILRQPVALSGGAGTAALAADLSTLDYAALVIGNPSTAGAAAGYTWSARAIAPLLLTHQRRADTADTANPYPVKALVKPGTGAVDPAAVTLTFRVNGDAPVTVPMAPTGQPDEYGASLPAKPAGTHVEYRIDAATPPPGPQSVSVPAVPDAYFTFDVVSLYEPFETAGTWTVGDVGDAATSGVWQRVVPLGTIAQPGEDATPAPGTMCWVTQNGTVGGAAGEADVDGGKTTLFSPVFDLAAGGPYARVEARYRRWYSNQLGAATDDVWRVDVSNDGGSTWQNLETVAQGVNAWVRVDDDLLARYGAVGQVRFRFVAEDQGAGSLVEAGVDDFELIAVPTVAVAVGDGRDPGAGAGLPARLALSAPRPNPSRTGVVALTLELPAAAPATVRVLDVRGRLVRVLEAGGTPLAAGRHALAWDGRDGRGAVVASGIYLVEAQSLGSSARARIVRLR